MVKGSRSQLLPPLLVLSRALPVLCHPPSAPATPHSPWDADSTCTESKSTENVLTRTEVGRSSPPTILSTKKAGPDLTFHVTWSAGVFHPGQGGKLGDVLVVLLQFSGCDTWRSIAGTCQQKYPQKDVGKKMGVRVCLALWWP